jgi:hypothetical protein
MKNDLNYGHVDETCYRLHCGAGERNDKHHWPISLGMHYGESFARSSKFASRIEKFHGKFQLRVLN